MRSYGYEHKGKNPKYLFFDFIYTVSLPNVYSTRYL